LTATEKAEVSSEAGLLAQCATLGWDEFTWADAQRAVTEIAAGLRSRGLQRGDRLCLYVDAGPESIFTFFACQYVGVAAAIREPRMPTAEQLQIVNTCQPKMVAVEPGDVATLAKGIEETDAEHNPWVVDNKSGIDIVTVQTLREEGVTALEEDSDAGKADGNPEDIALLCTTSGTTGTPKAVMHSQEAMYHLGRYGEQLGRVQFNGDLVGERMAFPFESGYISYIMVTCWAVGMGLELNFLEAPELRKVLPEIRPAVMLLLPDNLSMLYKSVMGKFAAKKVPPAMKMYRKASTARLGSNGVMGSADNSVDPAVPLGGFFTKVSDVVCKKVRAQLGGNIRYIGTGAAKVDEEVTKFFWGCGLPLYEMFASTECLCITNNTSDGFKLGTPGHPSLHGAPHAESDMTELMIADDGEILVRGHLVMKGCVQHRPSAPPASWPLASRLCG
jgi:long-chain acyl-CoA synthetase